MSCCAGIPSTGLSTHKCGSDRAARAYANSSSVSPSDTFAYFVARQLANGYADVHTDGRADDIADRHADAYSDGHAHTHADDDADLSTDARADGHADVVSDLHANVHADAHSLASTLTVAYDGRANPSPFRSAIAVANAGAPGLSHGQVRRYARLPRSWTVQGGRKYDDRML